MSYTPIAQRKNKIQQTGEISRPVFELPPQNFSITESTPKTIDFTSHVSAVDVIKELPTGVGVVAGAIGGFAKDVAQSIARNVGSAALSFSTPSPKQVADPLSAEDFQSPLAQGFFETIFGKGETLKPVETRIAEAEPKIKEWQAGLKETLKTPELNAREKFVLNTLSNLSPSQLAFTGIMGSVGLDLTPFGGLEKSAYNALIKAKTTEEATLLLSKMGVSDDLAKEFATDVVKVKKDTDAKKLLDNIVKLQETTKPKVPTTIPSKTPAQTLEISPRETTVPKLGDLATKEVSAVEQPLLQEARKYKTAEEFVDSNFYKKAFDIRQKLYNETGSRGDKMITLYHGTDVDTLSKIEKSGKIGTSSEDITFFTKSAKEAKEYARNKAKYRGKEPAVIKVEIPAQVIRKGQQSSAGGYEYEVDGILDYNKDYGVAKHSNENLVATYGDKTSRAQLTDIWKKARASKKTSFAQTLAKNLDPEAELAKAGELQARIEKARAFGRTLKEDTMLGKQAGVRKELKVKSPDILRAEAKAKGLPELPKIIKVKPEQDLPVIRKAKEDKIAQAYEEYATQGKKIDAYSDEELNALYKIMEDELQTYKGADPLASLADNIARGKQKISVGSLKSEALGALGKGGYMRVFTKNKSVSSLDELADTLRNQGIDATESDILEAIAKRIDVLKEEKILLKEQGVVSRAEKRAAVKRRFEIEQKIKELMRSISKQKTTIGVETKKVVRKVTGQQDVSKKIITTEKALLKEKFAQQAKGAKLGAREARALKDIEIKKIISETHGRKAQIRVIADYFKLTDNELNSLIKNKNIATMNDRQYNELLSEIYGRAQQIAERTEARVQLEGTIHSLALKKWENVQQAMKLPPIKDMSADDFRKLDEVLSQYKEGDEFLTTRQLETIYRTELAGLRTKREVIEHLAKKTGVTPEEAKIAEPHPWMYDSQLRETDPFNRLLVDKYNISYLKATERAITVEKTGDKLVRLARDSRKKTLLDKLIPTDTRIRQFLESDATERIRLMKEMTPEEIKAAQFQDRYYRSVYDWMTKRALDKKFESRFEDAYFPHMRRGFLEAWKNDGFIKGLSEATQQFRQDQAMMKILDEKTGEVLPYQKWLGAEQFRTGALIPTENVALAFKKYVGAIEKAKQFDEFIPEMMTYVHSLSPELKTERGIEIDDSLKQFFKKWINSKKGRVEKGLVTPGSTYDWAIRTSVALVRVRDLGFNIGTQVASFVGEQSANVIMLRTKYPLGVARLATKQGREITKRYENFVGRSIYESFIEASNDVGDKLMIGVMGLFHEASRKANQTFLLSMMTKEEFKTGKISVERLAELRDKMGRYRVIEGAESIIGKSAEMAVVKQHKKWAIPLITASAKNMFTLSKMVKKDGPKALLTEQGAEFFTATLLTASIGIGSHAYYTELEKKGGDRTATEDLLFKMMRESLSLIGALNPKFLLSFATPRLSQFLADLGTALNDIIALSEYQSGEKEGKLKGVEELKRTVTPVVVKTLLKEPKKTTMSKTGLPPLPTLPKLPQLPKLPKI